MTADDMEKMAEHAEMMVAFCQTMAKRNDDGTTDGTWLKAAWGRAAHEHCESARYWREQRGKADLR